MSLFPRSHPLVYELHTRCWLRELGERRGTVVTLADVPEEEFVRWRQWGLSHVWLMGVWRSGPRSRNAYLGHPHTRPHLHEVLPGWTETDVVGSPYAIAEYRVPEESGGEEGLATFRERLHAAGLGLMLDFVPNHLGLDHPWLEQHPEYFVQNACARPETFLQLTSDGPSWIAHGKDPYFPAWDDTAQLDHRRADTRAAVIGQLRSVASRCDAVRCDMAMLLLKEVFARNWAHCPWAGPSLDTEFWAEAIAAVRRPGFLLLAEAYWDLEAQLQSLGFDYTYDKRVLDFLIERRPEALQNHLLDRGDEFICRSAHFLENHDEPRIASRVSFEEHQAAAWLILTLPGLRLLHEGQLAGARGRVPIHLSRRPEAAADVRIANLYERLLGVLQGSAVGKGQGRVLRPQSASAGDETPMPCLVIEWAGSDGTIELAVVNPGSQSSRCVMSLAASGAGRNLWKAIDVLAPERANEFSFCPSELALELSPGEIRLLRCRPVS